MIGSLPEPWLRGPIAGVPTLLQPVAHALVMAGENVEATLREISAEQLWIRPGGTASLGFHLMHLSGSTDRLLTYARGEGLSSAQLAALAREESVGTPPPSVADLLSTWRATLDRALAQIASTPETSLVEPRRVGRAELPSTVLGLLFHAAEHAQRHVGQLVTTAKIVKRRGDASTPPGMAPNVTRPSAKCRAFRQLHESGCFVIPNPWDAGSARLLEQLGFRALATTSAGFAWSLGRRDNHVSLAEALAHCRAIAAAVEIPVSADFEGGFAVEPESVGANISAATATGIAGLSVEDSTGDVDSPLFDFALAVERIRAARRAIDDSGTGVVLTARTEGFIVGRPDLRETIRRVQAFSEAGADCLYAPGLRTPAEISAVVAAVIPKPVNVLVGSDFATVADLERAGVRRISVGGALARAAWGGFLQAAREIAEHGTFAGLSRAVPFAEINRSFPDGSR